MKNAVNRLAVVALAVAALSLPLAAQAPAVYRADVPFEFTVGNSTMPAGHYDIRTWSGGALVLIESEAGKCYFNSIPKSGYLWTAQQPALVFNHYGDRYFLSAIKTDGFTRGTPASKEESELQKTNVSAAPPSQVKILLALR